MFAGRPLRDVDTGAVPPTLAGGSVEASAFSVAVRLSFYDTN
jgi:hypothetical protein